MNLDSGQQDQMISNWLARYGLSEKWDNFAAPFASMREGLAMFAHSLEGVPSGIRNAILSFADNITGDDE